MSNSLAVDIIKRRGKRPTERFKPEKLKHSLVAASLSVQTPRGQAEEAADLVIQSVTIWLSNKPKVTSDDIRRIAAKHLKTHHPDAAYMYETHHHTI